MQKTKKRLNAPLTYLDKPYPFVRVLLKKFFILALFKQRSGFFQKLIKICLSTYLEQGSLKFNPNT